MKKTFLLLFLTSVFLFSSCCPEPKELTPEEFEKEKEAVINVIKTFHKAVEDEKFSKIVPTLAGEVIFFGTDSSEIIKTFGEFKEKMQAQWKRYDKLEYGELTDVSIQMDKQATIASIIFGVICDIYKGDRHKQLYLRVGRTLKKENYKWVIVSGIVGAASADDTLGDLDAPENEEEK